MADQTPRPVYLVTSRIGHSRRRMALFVPSLISPSRGTLIQVIGAPMTGFTLQFKRNCDPTSETGHLAKELLGHIPSSHVYESAPSTLPSQTQQVHTARLLRGDVVLTPVSTQNPTAADADDDDEMKPRSDIERAALTVPVPRAASDPLAPVDGVETKDSQNWMREYLQLLVNKGWLDRSAMEILTLHEDAPEQGIMSALSSSRLAGSPLWQSSTAPE